MILMDETQLQKLQAVHDDLVEMNRNLKEVNARTNARRAKYQLLIESWRENRS